MARRQCYNSPMNSDLSGRTRPRMPFLGRTLCRGPTKTPSANQDTSLCHSPNVFASPQGPGWNVQGVFRGGRPGVQVCVQDDIDV